MPRKGYRSITVSEELLVRLKARSDAEGVSIPRLIEKLLESSQKERSKPVPYKGKASEKVYGTLETYLRGVPYNQKRRSK